MAAGYVCNLCEGERGPVTQLITSLVNGATVASCREDLPVFMVGALGAELGLDADRLYDAIRRFESRERDRIAKAAKAAADAAQAEAERADLDEADPNTEYGQDDADALNELLQEADHDQH